MNNEEQLLDRIEALRRALSAISNRSTPDRHLRSIATSATSVDNFYTIPPQIMEDSLSEAHQKIEALATSIALIDDSIATLQVDVRRLATAETDDALAFDNKRLIERVIRLEQRSSIDNNRRIMADRELEERIEALKTDSAPDEPGL